jgi:phytanoyl-CoA hydroxylase
VNRLARRKPIVLPDETQRYASDGVVSVGRPVISAAEVSEIRSILNALFARGSELPERLSRDIGESTDSRQAVPEIIWTTHLAPALRRTAGFRRLRRAAAELLGADHVRLHFDHAIFKPARTGGPTAWHQDVAFDPGFDVPVATIWLALIGTNEQNGCMRFIPGSHLTGILEHRLHGHHGLEAVGVDESTAHSYPLPAGGFTVHMQRTLHGSGPNRSEDVRAGWILKFTIDNRPATRRSVASVRECLKRRSKPTDLVIADALPGIVMRCVPEAFVQLRCKLPRLLGRLVGSSARPSWDSAPSPTST